MPWAVGILRVSGSVTETCFCSSSSSASSSLCQSCLSCNAAILAASSLLLMAAPLGGVGGVQLLEILRQPGIGPRDEVLEFGGIKILIARVDRRELAAINGQQFPAEQFQLPAQQGELPRHGFEGF